MKSVKSFGVVMMLLAIMAVGCSKKADVTGNTAAGVKNFNATVSMMTPAGSMDGKIYVSGDKIRTEMPQAITISRLDKGIVWILMPDQKVYVEQQLGPDHVVSFSEKIPGEVKREKMAEESVGSRKAQKYLVTYKIGEEDSSVYQWVDEDSGMPIKMAGVDGGWSYEFQNIEPGMQVAELFEIPSGYNKMEMPAMPQAQ
jgi:hypothetical protein